MELGGRPPCFSQEGTAIVAVDVNDVGGQETVQMIMDADGGRAVYVHADVSKAADCERMVAAAEDVFGKLNVLFNNAGIMHSRRTMTPSTPRKMSGI